MQQKVLHGSLNLKKRNQQLFQDSVLDPNELIDISQKFKEEDVIKLSETMKHSPLATELYVRKIQPLSVENMIKLDERKLVYEEPEMIQTRSRVLEKRQR
jgi:hypothetical protein